ncbi:MAG: sigma-54 dependent transcriptional regulator [Candidatus Cloacimonetes bacterium]|nr:sigma-54 dependent transcriptional regulator [Candidatus Cloacimonadota bacterium]
MNVLIIDDEINIRQTLRSILEDEGYDCETAANGKEGIKQLENFNADVILLDVQMDEMDGLTALEHILKADPTLQVIMISGHSGIGEAVRAIKTGAFDFLEKPLSLPKVKITVSKAAKFRQLSMENRRLKIDIEERYQLIGNSPPMQKLREMIRKVAPSNAKVLIRGESGTGKELVAWAIHQQSGRADKPFIRFNSAAIPAELVESELFGFEKGAFTGAVKGKKGKLEEADGGTLFLDEIGDMSLSAQSKILRVIQEGEFERVGSNKTHKIDARIIAATHKNLEEMVAENLFRDDLFYRLNVVPIHTPALRQHPEDMSQLVNHLSCMAIRDLNVTPKNFLPETICALKGRVFPGNVRELKNLIERIYILEEKEEIAPDDLPETTTRKSNSDFFWQETLSFTEKKKDFEARYLEVQLELHGHNVSRTAEALSMHQSNLSRKLKELGIKL